MHAVRTHSDLPQEDEAEAASEEGSEHFDTEVEQAGSARSSAHGPQSQWSRPAAEAFMAFQANLDLSAWKLSHQPVAQKRQAHPSRASPVEIHALCAVQGPALTR